MKPFHIKFDGAKAVISVNIEAGGQWYKKTLTATDGQELWEGLERLLKVEGLPVEKKIEAAEYISRAKEQEYIELALPAWLAKGNKIKVVPRAGGKLVLEESLKEEILKDLFNTSWEPAQEELYA